MIYREVPLPVAARPSAFCAWRFVIEEGDLAQFAHTIPPDGTTGLIISRSPDGQAFALRIPPRLTAQVIEVMRGWTYVGLRLRPEAAASITGVPAGSAGSPPLPLDGEFAPVWTDLLAFARDGTDWAGTTAFLTERHRADAAIAAAVDLFVAGRATVAEAADAVGLSLRQFRRRFQAATSLAPRDYAGVQRARGALILSLSDASWAEIAHDAGYADQPHLARDIRDRFGGPLARVGGYFGAMRHEMVTPADGRFVQDAMVRTA